MEIVRIHSRTPWRDRNVLMHWPRAAFVYCFLLIGTFLSEQVIWERIVVMFIGMFFLLQLAAYRLDEMKGRHCSTKLSDKELKTTVAIGLIGGGVCSAVAIWWDPWMIIWIAIGLAGVVLYNYEIAGFHNMWFFGFTWGWAPLWAAYFFHTGMTVPPLELFAWGAFAVVLARLHIWSYGNTRCYHAVTCKDMGYKLGTDDKCHGQYCGHRIGNGGVRKRTHRLQWHLINLQLYLVITVTVAIILSHF